MSCLRYTADTSPGVRMNFYCLAEGPPADHSFALLTEQSPDKCIPAGSSVLSCNLYGDIQVHWVSVTVKIQEGIYFIDEQRVPVSMPAGSTSAG